MDKYALIGKMTAQAGKRDELISILTKAAQIISSAKGCHHYIVYKDAQYPEVIWMSEIWDTEEDHNNSLKFEGCSELILQAMPLLASRPEKTELAVVGGKGI